MGRLEEMARGASLGDIGAPTPRAVAFFSRFIRPVVAALFRPTLEGVEHLPPSGPFLLVSNHSAGLAIAEILSFGALYLERVGPARRLAGFAHPIGFQAWPTKQIHQELGSIPSTYEAALDALARGVPVLVFPGGDHESLRPLWQAHRVDFGGRVGFLRIAQRAGVPIVPMGIRGSHFTVPILWRSRALATLLLLPRLVWGGKRWALSLLGLLGSVAIALTPLPLVARAALIFLWLGTPLTMLPIIPATIRMRIGRPLAVSELFEGEDPALEKALARVETAVQALVDPP